MVAALLALLLAACGDDTPTYRYRLTVEVETPEGLKTGSSVIEVDTRIVRPGSAPAGQGARFSHRGEAVAVDMPDGRTLFALLRSDNDSEWASRVMLLLSPRMADESWAERFDDMMALKGKGEIEVPRRWPKHGFLEERSAYPMLVTFDDVADPATVALVDPNDLTATFGEGFDLKRITVQITDDRVTEGLENRLEWLDGYRERYFNGTSTISKDVTTDDLRAHLTAGDFSTEFAR